MVRQRKHPHYRGDQAADEALGGGTGTMNERLSLDPEPLCPECGAEMIKKDRLDYYCDFCGLGDEEEEEDG